MPAPQPFLPVERLFLERRATVYRWAVALGADHQAALDIVQETFLQLVRSAPRFDSAAAQLGWLRRVASNLVADRHRSRRPPLRLSGREAAPPAADGAQLDAAAITGAMDSLSEMQRLVLLAKTADGLTFAQVAAELGISIPTTKTHYLRALAAIRDRLRVDTPDRRSPTSTITRHQRSPGDSP